MNWNSHYALDGKHAFLSASNYHWLNYDADKLREVFINDKAKEIGTKYHEIAANDIRMRLKRPNNNQTFNRYINDAIKLRMQAEQKLVYNKFAFGTADAISFDGKILRIFDLKTGKKPAHMEQLQIYAALFCLEYGHDPYDIEYDLRIYQNDDIVYGEIYPEDIKDIMIKIKEFCTILDDMDGEIG